MYRYLNRKLRQQRGVTQLTEVELYENRKAAQQQTADFIKVWVIKPILRFLDVIVTTSF